MYFYVCYLKEQLILYWDFVLVCVSNGYIFLISQYTVTKSISIAEEE